jgi:GH25 family lysozyme M1 (1,4-beta-N-acetylmuramidase)
VQNGIPYGVYLYSYANTVSEANSEANHALRLLKANNCKLQYPIYYDLEDTQVSKASNATIVAMANVFCSKLSSNGYASGVYANLNWWNNKLSAFNGYDKWVAQWASKCTYGKSYSIWQCSSEASVSGISGRVDANLLMCTRSVMDKYMHIVTYSFQTIEGKQYLVSSEGNIIKNMFFKYGAYTYGFDANGVKQVNKTLRIGNRSYILDNQGRAYINKSKTKKKAPYYAKAGSGKKGKLKKGKSFYVLRTSGKWSQMANGYWIKTSLTKKTVVYPNISPSVKVNYKAKLKKKTVSRSGPSNSYIKKKTFKKNRKVTVIGTYGSWSKISSGQWLPSSRLKR